MKKEKSKKYKIRVGLGVGTLVKQEFNSIEEAEKWADWNYKGRTNFKIVKV